MKKIFTTALIALSVMAAVAQDVDRKEIKFDYIRLPMKPLVKGTTRNAQGEIVPDYLKKIEEQKAAFQRKKDEAEQKYLMDMALYQDEVKREDERYQKEVDAYNKKTTAQKIIDKQLLEQGKPIKKTIYPPSKQSVVEERTGKVFNHEALAAEYLRPEGYSSNRDNAVMISVTLLGFESTVEFKTSTKNTMVKQSNGTYTSVPTTTYFYELKYRHPMRLKVVSPTLGVVSDDLMFNDDRTTRSAEYKSDYEARNAYNSQKDAILSKAEDQVVNENMASIRTQLNNQHGYAKTNRAADLYDVSSKKQDYSSINKAYESAFEGMMLLYESANPTRAKEKLAAATAMWEKDLSESNIKDKKSRINADVTLALLFNIAEANIWLGNFNRAEECLNKLNLMDLNKKERGRLEEERSFFKDMKERANANA